MTFPKHKVAPPLIDTEFKKKKPPCKRVELSSFEGNDTCHDIICT